LDDKEPMDNMLMIVEAKPWILVAAVAAVLGSLLVWGLAGTMQAREDASGVLVRVGKTIDIFADTDTVVLDVAVERGDHVEADDALVRVEQIDLVAQINILLEEGAPQSEIHVLRQELIQKSQFLSTVSGVVYDVYVRPGQYVKRGDRMMTIHADAGSDKSLECLLFVPVADMRSIRLGQDVNVYPDGIKKETYGNMTGRISFISENPVSRQYLYDTLGSDELTEAFEERGACYEVALTLSVSEEAPTGFKWTTSNGPNKPFGNMTLCDASIIVDELRPIDVFFFKR
jgi:HlyD family secretion protein